jgi:hypothetical protein
MSVKIDETLASRELVYGDYPSGIRLRATLMAAIKTRYKEMHKMDMPVIDEEHFRDIIQKLSRLAVTPRHIDSWHDIAGYARLVENDLRGFEHLNPVGDNDE